MTDEYKELWCERCENWREAGYHCNSNKCVAFLHNRIYEMEGTLEEQNYLLSKLDEAYNAALLENKALQNELVSLKVQIAILKGR